MFLFQSIILFCSILLAEPSESAESIVRTHEAVFDSPPARIPVPHATDAPMLGNGYTGVAIGGSPEHQTYYVARNDFWRLKSGLNQSFPAVLGKVELQIPSLREASYEIRQNLYEAKTVSRFSSGNQSVEITQRVLASDDMFVITLKNTGDQPLAASASLSLPGLNELINKPPFDSLFAADTELEQEGNVQYLSRGFSHEVDIPTKAAMALKNLSGDLDEITIQPGAQTTWTVFFSSDFKSDDCVRTVLAMADEMNDKKLDQAILSHSKWWEKYWSQSFVDIPDKKVEKQYYVSLYALGSFSRDLDFPPSIFGTCITKERPHWNGDYHLNYNHYAPYYGLFSSNRLDQAIPSNQPLLKVIDRGRYYSNAVCEIPEGILLPVGIGPLGIETTRRNTLMEEHREHWFKNGDVEDEGLFFGQKSNSAYAVVNMAQHFYTTYDPAVARLYYPFVKGVADFWTSYLTWEGGRYVIYNDAIHEGTVGTMNPILSLGMVRMVMKLAIDLSEGLGQDKESREKWLHVIENLSGYSYQEKDGKKVFRYTENGVDWWGDNTLGIQHIYPAGQIGLDSDPELKQVAHNTIDIMQRWIDFNGSNSFFPAAVRVGYDAEEILNQLNKYVDNTYPNGFQLKNPHGIENLSTVPNTVNEMLCMGNEGIIRVFPVWPSVDDAKFSKLRKEGAFLVSSELKNGSVQYVEVSSEAGRKLVLQNPWKGKKVGLVRNGRRTVLDGANLIVDTKEGDQLTFKPINP